MGKPVHSVGVEAGVRWDGYGADELAGRVAMLFRALDRGEGPVHEVTGLLDAFHGAQLAALLACLPRRPDGGAAPVRVGVRGRQ